MPKRSNDFQHLISLIYRELAGSDKRVTESKMVKDLMTGEDRELDVVIEGVIDDKPIIISVECRDHARTQSVEWIEGLIGKYSDLPVTKVVAVSKSGFSKQVQRNAAGHRIEILSLKAAEATGWVALAGETKPTKYVIVQSYEVVNTRIDVDDPSALIPLVGRKANDVDIYRADGSLHGSVAELYNYMGQEQQQALNDTVMRTQDPMVGVVMLLPPGMFVIDMNGGRHIVEKVTFTLQIYRETMAIPLAPATLGMTQIEHGASSTSRWKAVVAQVKDGQKPTTFGMSVQPMTTSSQEGTSLMIYTETTQDSQQVFAQVT